VIACDLTFGSTKGDYAVAQVWGSDGPGRYLLAQWRKRAGLLESVGAIKALAAAYPRAKVIVEKAANGAGAIEELAAAGLAGVVAVKPLGSKAERIGMVSATIEAGNAILPLGASWLADFVEELAGATKHDDAQDCAAYAIHELNAGSSGNARGGARW
jgi:predicted phage terminase large subunit-like protein